MAGRSVHGALALLVLGNMIAMFSDVVIKMMGSDIPLFQFVFMRLLCGVTLLTPCLLFLDRGAFRHGLPLHVVRAHIGIVAVVCMVLALQTLPLATANAVFYTAPILIMVLAVIFYGERVTPLSLLAVFSGFAGILVALRPIDLNWQSLTALGTSAALAMNVLLVRKLPPQQTSLHTMILTQTFALPATLALMLWEGAPWDWSLMTYAVGSSVFIMVYNICILISYRYVDANRVTSAEYTGIVWAVLLGWWWFGEVPDLWFFAGATLICGPLLLLGLRERHRARLRAVATHAEG